MDEDDNDDEDEEEKDNDDDEDNWESEVDDATGGRTRMTTVRSFLLANKCAVSACIHWPSSALMALCMFRLALPCDVALQVNTKHASTDSVACWLASKTNAAARSGSMFISQT